MFGRIKTKDTAKARQLEFYFPTFPELWTLAVIVGRHQILIDRSIMTTENYFLTDLAAVKSLLYDKCDYKLNNFSRDTESSQYSACSFQLNELFFVHRASKITPTKAGQFVTIWKRSENGITTPYDISDNIDWFIITSRSGDKLGQFVFPKMVLADKGVISINGKGGKRGIRVYPQWSIPPNKQAEETQRWQQNYFCSINQIDLPNHAFIKRLFDKSNIN